jgi:hypothetical protein
MGGHGHQLRVLAAERFRPRPVGVWALMACLFFTLHFIKEKNLAKEGMRSHEPSFAWSHFQNSVRIESGFEVSRGFYRTATKHAEFLGAFSKCVCILKKPHDFFSLEIRHANACSAT